MKTKYTDLLAMTASFALGALAVQGLHAQAKPTGYVVVEVAVTDKDGYAKEFIPPAAKAIEEGGGKYVVRGGKTVSFQGTPPASRVVVLQFESMDKAQAWSDPQVARTRRPSATSMRRSAFSQWKAQHHRPHCLSPSFYKIALKNAAQSESIPFLEAAN